MFVLIACSSGAAATPSAAAPSAPASAGAPSGEPSATARVGPPEGQASTFIVAETAVGIGSVAFKAAIDAMNANGYTIETPVLDASELVSQGVASGQFQFGSGANSSALLAMEAGGEMKFIIDRNANEWTIVTTSAIEDCAGLVANRVAIHSPGSVSGAMIRDWIGNTCPDSLPDFEPLIIAGSQNRAAALEAGQIDGTPAELRDWIALSSTGGDKYKILVNFTTDLPDLHPTSMYANTEFIEANPDVTKDLIREILLQHRKINSEDGYLLALYQKYLPEEAANAELAKLVTDTYIDEHLFDNNGGLTAAAVDYTTKFFGPDGTGDLQANMPVDEVSDLSLLDAVLEEIGRE
ncbi:MAG: ABC transporter substrate-binding protein [Candidatus Limnocylindrales bacterium]